MRTKLLVSQARFLFAVALGLVCAKGPALGQAVQPELLYVFTNGPAAPYCSLAQGPDGSFYGATVGGGLGYGTVFQVATNGALTTLTWFGFTNGAYPYAGLTPGPDGSFYGTTSGGGASGYGTVFKISPDGALTTLWSFSNGDGANPEAGLTFGLDGSLYGTTSGGGSQGNGTVFRVTTDGTLTTLASFSYGANPKGGLTLASDGSVYGTTQNGGGSGYGTVFQVTTNGGLTTLVSFSGNNGAYPEAGLTQGSDGNFYGTTSEGGDSGHGTVFRVTTNGLLTMLFSFDDQNGAYPDAGLTLGPDGNLYGTTSERGRNGGGVVYRIVLPPQQIQSNEGVNLLLRGPVNNLMPPISWQWQFDGIDIPGATDGTLSLTNLQDAKMGFYSVLISNAWGVFTNMVAEVFPVPEPYTFSTLAGLAGNGGSNDGTNNAAQFNSPRGVAFDSAGNLFVADSGNNVIRKLTRTGTNWVTTTLVGQVGVSGSADGTNGAALFNGPRHVALDSAGDLFVTDYANNTIRKLVPVGTNWVVSTVAGLAGSPGSADGTNDSARFDGIRGLAVDAATNLFVTEIGSHVIRMVTPLGTNWVVNTIAGLAGSPGAADGTNSAARFNRPYDVTVDGSGNLFVTDNGNALIRMVTPCGSNWVVRTISGQAGQNATLDGINTNALFTGPDGIAVDGMGNLFVTDIDDYTIRELRLIGTNWFAATIGGVAGMAGSTDGLNSTALFNWPSGIAVDGAGNLYLAEIANDTIRMGTPLQARPSLTAFFATHSLVLSWPLSAAGFALELSASAGTGATWMTMTNGIVNDGSRFYVTNTLSAAAGFFRLRR